MLRTPSSFITLLCLLLPSSGAAEFSDAASAAGFFGGQPTWGAQIYDVDQDGDLDILKANHFYSAFLFTNRGGLEFSVWDLPQLVTNSGDRHGWLWADLTGDGIPDVVCSHGGNGGCGCVDDGNELYRGLGAGLYELVPGALGMVDPTGRGRVFSAADIDGDGDLDLFHGKAPLAASPSSLYRNDGVLGFVDVAAAWGVDETIGCEGVRFEDIDDDGDPDLLVGGIEDNRPTIYYRNDGGSFSNATSSAFGVLPVATGLDWGDVDNDGDMDLLLVEGLDGVFDAFKVNGTDYWLFAHYRLGEDGVDIFEFDTPGEDPTAFFRFNGVAYISDIFLGPLAVNPNPGATTLDDSYVGAPPFTPGTDFGLFVWRSTPGGRWNFHVSGPAFSYGNFGVRIETVGGVVNPTSSNLESEIVPTYAPRVWRNDGGTFSEIVTGIVADRNPRDATWVDFDNDGDLDIHVVYRGSILGNETDALYRNDGGSFTTLDGVGWIPGTDRWMADGATWGDLDRDGDLDVILQEGAGPAFFTIAAPAKLYRNDGPTGNWLVVAPESGADGETPIGTRVDAYAGGQRIHRRLTASSWRGFQGPGEIHLGLGSATWVDSVVVTWPDASVQTIRNFPANQILRLVPGEDPTAGPRPTHIASRVGPIVPQPARGRQSIRLAGVGPGLTRVRVYDLAGRRVADLGNFETSVAVTVSWDGRDTGGNRVPPGVYFLRGTGTVPFDRKAVRLR